MKIMYGMGTGDGRVFSSDLHPLLYMTDMCEGRVLIRGLLAYVSKSGFRVLTKP